MFQENGGERVSNFTIALLQISALDEPGANLEKGETYCRRAGAMGADLALFPEMWNTGYSLFDPAGEKTYSQWTADAVSIDDAFVHHFQALAAGFAFFRINYCFMAGDKLFFYCIFRF